MNAYTFGPGDADWECLAEATLDIYTGTDDGGKREAALRVWDDLTLLNLAIPPPWVIAVWVATGVIGGPERGDHNRPLADK